MQRRCLMFVWRRVWWIYGANCKVVESSSARTILLARRRYFTFTFTYNFSSTILLYTFRFGLALGFTFIEFSLHIVVVCNSRSRWRDWEVFTFAGANYDWLPALATRFGLTRKSEREKTRDSCNDFFSFYSTNACWCCNWSSIRITSCAHWLRLNWPAKSRVEWFQLLARLDKASSFQQLVSGQQISNEFQAITMSSISTTFNSQSICLSNYFNVFDFSTNCFFIVRHVSLILAAAISSVIK